MPGTAPFNYKPIKLWPFCPRAQACSDALFCIYNNNAVFYAHFEGKDLALDFLWSKNAFMHSKLLYCTENKGKYPRLKREPNP